MLGHSVKMMFCKQRINFSNKGCSGSLSGGPSTNATKQTFAALKSDGKHEREKQLVLLEQWAAHVVVNACGKVFVKVFYTQGEILRFFAIFNWLKRENFC